MKKAQEENTVKQVNETIVAPKKKAVKKDTLDDLLSAGLDGAKKGKKK